jgi:FkbM family methyltransferase
MYVPPQGFEELLLATNGRISVLDLGANVGLFAAFVFARQDDAHVTSVEPDHVNLAILRGVRAANPTLDWRVIEAGAGVAVGEVGFVSGLFADSHVSADGENSSTKVPIIDVFDLGENFDLVKMDIEGSEWAILEDQRLATWPVSGMVLEWHARGCPEPDPHEYVLQLLTRAGFSHIVEREALVPASGKPRVGLVWARRP